MKLKKLNEQQEQLMPEQIQVIRRFYFQEVQKDD